MKYFPIENEDDIFQRIEESGYQSYTLAVYEEQWERDQGEPYFDYFNDLKDAFTAFEDGCTDCLCVELRGIRQDGGQTSLLIGGTADDLSEDGQYIQPE